MRSEKKVTRKKRERDERIRVQQEGKRWSKSKPVNSVKTYSQVRKIEEHIKKSSNKCSKSSKVKKKERYREAIYPTLCHRSCWWDAKRKKKCTTRSSDIKASRARSISQSSWLWNKRRRAQLLWRSCVRDKRGNVSHSSLDGDKYVFFFYYFSVMETRSDLRRRYLMSLANWSWFTFREIKMTTMQCGASST